MTINTDEFSVVFQLFKAPWTWNQHKNVSSLLLDPLLPCTLCIDRLSKFGRIRRIFVIIVVWRRCRRGRSWKILDWWFGKKTWTFFSLVYSKINENYKLKKNWQLKKEGVKLLKRNIPGAVASCLLEAVNHCKSDIKHPDRLLKCGVRDLHLFTFILNSYHPWKYLPFIFTGQLLEGEQRTLFDLISGQLNVNFCVEKIDLCTLYLKIVLNKYWAD